jgi:hypothetical protein
MKTIFRSIYIKILSIVLVIYSVIGFIILPYLIQSNFSSLIKQELNANAYISRVYINPFTFEVGLHNLLIQDEKNTLLLYFKSFRTNINLTSLLFAEIRLNYILIESLKTSVTLSKNKALNFSHILKQLSQKTKTSVNKTKVTNTSPLLFSVNNIQLMDTRLKYIDKTKSENFEVETKPFILEIKNFSTKENNIAKISTNIEVIDTLNIELNSDLILSPTKINGNIAIRDLKLVKIHEYLQDDLKFKFSGLIKSISSSFMININKKQLQAEIQNLNINIPEIDYNDKKVNIIASNINNSIKNIKVIKDEELSYIVNQVNFTAKQTQFIDLLKDKNHHLTFRNFVIAMDKFSSKKEEENKVSLSLNTPRSGTININAKTIQEPLTLDAIASIKKFDIVPYKEYIKDFINIDIKKTYLDIDSKILLLATKQKVEGNIKISQIDITHNITKTRLLKMNTFDIMGLKYTNNNLFVKNVNLDTFQTSFKIGTNKKTNLDRLIVTKKNKKSIKNNSKKSTFNYYIKKLKISNGRTEFSDHSLPLNFDTNIHGLNATIHDLSSKNDEASIKIKGVIEKYGLADIEAHSILSNFKNMTDVKINFKNLDVSSFSPYSGKFIGQKIADGRLWLALNYSIRNAQLSSTNNIKIKNLTLGEDVNSPEAMSIPVGLAIALLEDGDGLIDLDVPVKGNMDKPQFELSGVIWKTLGNIITNIVTAPFRFLGSLLGLDSDELGIITFNFSEAEVLPPQKEKLDKLIQIFQKKKNLVVVVEPTINILNDSIYLKEKKFKKLIESKNRNKTIKEMYIKKFGKKSFDSLVKKHKKDEIIGILSAEIKNTILISTKDLELVAKQRALNIKKYFLANKLTLDRIQIKNNVFENKDDTTNELSLKLELNIKDRK